MYSKITIIVLGILMLSACRSQEFKAKEKDSAARHTKQEIIKDRENSKKYALSICLFENGYKFTDTSKIDNSAYSYIARGLKHVGFYSEVSNFTKQQIKKYNYQSFEGNKVVLKMAECIDFYTSKELEDFILSIENNNYNE